MKSSPYLEQRARAAAEAFRFLNEWAAPDFADLSSTEVKRSLFRSNGRYLLSEMLRRDAISNTDIGDLASALHHAWSVDDNAEVIDAGHGVTENVFANVYDLLFASEQRATDDTGSHYVYRGQRDARWSLIASACRGHPNVWTLDSPDRKEQMVENILRKLVTPEAKSRGLAQHFATHWPAERCDKIKQLLLRFPGLRGIFGSLNELQQDAVLQHYLSGTPLLDFSKSVYVAAFFACRPPDCGDLADEGAIYRVSTTDVEDELTLGRKVEAPGLPDLFLRVHRQRGVFLEVEFPALLNEPGLFERWVFYQTDAGRSFESPTHGVTEELLLPDEIKFSD
jgi:hypothetical protein